MALAPQHGAAARVPTARKRRPPQVLPEISDGRTKARSGPPHPRYKCVVEIVLKQYEMVTSFQNCSARWSTKIRGVTRLAHPQPAFAQPTIAKEIDGGGKRSRQGCRGIRIAFDDFGTGYSSMSLMKQFPIDTIKIDRSFVRDIPRDSEDQAIAQAIISMGKALGMTVVAEGVETTEQEAFLRDHACDEMQGFFFSKPVPAERMPDLFRQQLHVSPPTQPEFCSESSEDVVNCRPILSWPQHPSRLPLLSFDDDTMRRVQG